MNIPVTIVTAGLFIPYTGFARGTNLPAGDDANSLAEGLADAE